jgi:hypothetical protein
VQALIKGKIDKAKFKRQTEYYRAENALVAEAERQLKELPEAYVAHAMAEIHKGRWSKEYLAHVE